MTTKTLIEQLHQVHKDAKQVESCLGALLQIQEENVEQIEIIKKKLEEANDKARQL